MRRPLLSLLATLACLTGAATAQTPVDLLITHGHVLTMDPARAVIEDGFVAIRGERILAVGPATRAADYAPARTIDARSWPSLRWATGA